MSAFGWFYHKKLSVFLLEISQRIWGAADLFLSGIFVCTLYCLLWTLYKCAVGGYETAGTRCDIQKTSANVSIDKMIWYGLRVQRRVCSSSSCDRCLVKNWRWWIRCATVSPIGPPGHG